MTDFTSESKAEYDADAAKYFKNIQGTKNQGLSADDMALADRHLPSKEAEQKNLDRLTKGFDKTSRSGAYSAPGKSAAIFPNGLKFASDFIEEMTPGKYKPAAPMKPPDEQKKPTGYVPKPAVVVSICIDCMKEVDPKAYIGGLTICAEEDTHKCTAMGIKYGDMVVYCLCVPCNDKAMQMAKDVTPLALVFGGGLKDPRDVVLAAKYGFPIDFHDGTEKTYGQFLMCERAERIMQNLWDYIQSENEKPESPIFRTRPTTKEAV